MKYKGFIIFKDTETTWAFGIPYNEDKNIILTREDCCGFPTKESVKEKIRTIIFD